MHLRVAVFLSFCVVLWHWCDGQRIPEEVQTYNISPPNMFVRESPTNKTIDQFIMEAMGGLKGALNLKSKNGDILVELDMLLSKEQYDILYEHPNSSSLIRSKRKAIRNPIYHWTKGEIPYRFYLGEFRQDHQIGIRQAMTEWERYTCLRFREATSSDFNVIVFRDKRGCYSKVGMQGGQQEVSLSSDGCRNTRTYLHEIGHAIGLVHEHMRPDRDDYVEILRENVEPNNWYNFEKATPIFVDLMNVPYDYSSIMHYGAYFFTKNGKKTIRVKYPEKGVSIGEASTLSFADVQIVNKMYRCHAKCDPRITCSGGYVDKNCRCLCKNGSQDCQIGGGIKPSGECTNLHSDNKVCDAWAKAGYCKTNQFVTVNCAKSCGNCSERGPSTSSNVRFADNLVNIATEKLLINEVNEQAPADDPNGGCRDEKDTCANWARNGFCKNHRDQAVRICPKACNLCDLRQGLLLR